MLSTNERGSENFLELRRTSRSRSTPQSCRELKYESSDLFSPSVRFWLRLAGERDLVKNHFVVLGLLAVSLGMAAEGSAQEVYSNDFSGPVGSEWSATQRDVTPVGSRSFLGQFANQTVSLHLGGLPSHTGAILEFDLFLIRTWDGNNSDDGGQNGPDAWKLDVDGATPLLNTTFSNVYYFPGFNQSYPNAAGQGDFAPFTGASEVNSLGYFEPGGNSDDSVYHFLFAFDHTAPTITFNFTSLQSEAIDNESWGLDNVRVAAVPEPTTLSVWIAAPVAFGVRRRLRTIPRHSRARKVEKR
jgi:hypothetical protein